MAVWSLGCSTKQQVALVAVAVAVTGLSFSGIDGAGKPETTHCLGSGMPLVAASTMARTKAGVS